MSIIGYFFGYPDADRGQFLQYFQRFGGFGSNPVTPSNVDRGDRASGGTLSTPRRPIAVGDSDA